MGGIPGPVTSVAAGSGFTCAGTADAGVWCFGTNFEGNLGDGTLYHSRLPVQVKLP